MRVVVIGATGNVGTSVVAALSGEPAIDELVGVARRAPEGSLPVTEFHEADVTKSELTELLGGADAVIHLAWLIQPGRDRELMHAVNVGGTERVLDAAARAGVGTLLYASSVGAYSPGPKDRKVDERWPTNGIRSSFYSRHKAAAERLLDRFEREQPAVRVVRLRPGLIFKADAADEIRRYFIGTLAPRFVFARRLLPIVPDLPSLRFQAVHSLDVGEAFRLALLKEAKGAFNVASEPVLGPEELAHVFSARPVRVPRQLLRGAADLSYRVHLQPVEPGWLDMALEVPLMDTTRVRGELGWAETRDGVACLQELLDGIGAGTGAATPPLAPRPMPL